MPKIYVSIRFKYSQENLVEAVQAVKLKTHKLSDAAREFGIPKGTLSKKVRGLTPLARKMGTPTVLSAEVEKVIADWIIAKAKVGFPIHPENVFDSVQKILVDSNAKTTFNESRPGKKWFQLFMQRHPNIVKRKKTNKTNKKKKISTKGNNISIFSRGNLTKTSSKTKKNKAINVKRDKKDLDDDELPLASLQKKYNVGDYVIVCYEKKQYPGVIKKYDNRSEFEVSVMERRLNSLWKWPILPDQISYPKEDIVKKIERPIPVNSRKLFL